MVCPPFSVPHLVVFSRENLMISLELKRCKFILTMALILILTLSGAVSAEKRTALVIGNGSYKSALLANAVNDATDMKTLLVTDLGA